MKKSPGTVSPIPVFLHTFAPDKNMNAASPLVFGTSFKNNIHRNPGTVVTLSHIDPYRGQSMHNLSRFHKIINDENI